MNEREKERASERARERESETHIASGSEEPSLFWHGPTMQWRCHCFHCSPPNTTCIYCIIFVVTFGQPRVTARYPHCHIQPVFTVLVRDEESCPQHAAPQKRRACLFQHTPGLCCGIQVNKCQSKRQHSDGAVSLQHSITGAQTQGNQGRRHTMGCSFDVRVKGTVERIKRKNDSGGTSMS